MSRPVSLLDHALLGLIGQANASGYDLRKVFATTPMASFSDSPGAIYPALARLEAGGLIRGRVEESAGLRRRKIYRLTAAGTAELHRWLSNPPTRDEVVSRMDEIILRFAFMEAALGKASVLKFLGALEAELAAYVPVLHVHLSTHRESMATSAWLALDFGIRSYETTREWCRRAISAYEGKPRRGKP
jgi:PadR family transcriptional regulator AphA